MTDTHTADPENTLILELEHGTVTIALRPDLAPRHVEQIKTLARRGFYDGVPFHRVIEGFMAQGGDPTGTGRGGSDLPDIEAEVAAIAARNGTAIEVRPFEGLLVQYAREIGAKMIIRGLRAVADFDYEFQMVGMNRRLAPDIETVFLMASETNQFIASRLVKEIARLGGDISGFVPATTLQRTLAKLRAGHG